MNSHFHYENWLEQIQQPEINLQWMYYNPQKPNECCDGSTLISMDLLE